HIDAVDRLSSKALLRAQGEDGVDGRVGEPATWVGLEPHRSGAKLELLAESFQRFQVGRLARDEGVEEAVRGVEGERVTRETTLGQTSGHHPIASAEAGVERLAHGPEIADDAARHRTGEANRHRSLLDVK